ncbi:hypothetical protein BRX37_23515 [Sphingomonas sp. S-NIH.Pt3_0716]|nr:hypothetical protein BRX37_23515 [Sphingomonas sp. S-NIH.Pt3_0716]
MGGERTVRKSSPSKLGEELETSAFGRFLQVLAGIILTKVRIHSALWRMGSAEWIPNQVRDDGTGEVRFSDRRSNKPTIVNRR